MADNIEWFGENGLSADVICDFLSTAKRWIDRHPAYKDQLLGVVLLLPLESLFQYSYDYLLDAQWLQL